MLEAGSGTDGFESICWSTEQSREPRRPLSLSPRDLSLSAVNNGVATSVAGPNRWRRDSPPPPHSANESHVGLFQAINSLSSYAGPHGRFCPSGVAPACGWWIGRDLWLAGPIHQQWQLFEFSSFPDCPFRSGPARWMAAIVRPLQMPCPRKNGSLVRRYRCDARSLVPGDVDAAGGRSFAALRSPNRCRATAEPTSTIDVEGARSTGNIGGFENNKKKQTKQNQRPVVSCADGLPDLRHKSYRKIFLLCDKTLFTLNQKENRAQHGEMIKRLS